ANGEEVPLVLRGVNVSGLEYRNPDKDPDRRLGAKERTPEDDAARHKRRWYEAAGIDQTMLTAIRSMGANIIRLTLSQEQVLGIQAPRDRRRPDYLTDVDLVIKWATDRHMYVLLNLHSLRIAPRQLRPAIDCETKNLIRPSPTDLCGPYTPPMPD